MKRVCLLSGGQDSSTVLALARGVGPVTAITFDYGQRHAIEIECAKYVAKILGVTDHRIMNLGPAFQSIESAMTSNSEIREVNGLPNTFLPGRNMILFTFACAAVWEKAGDEIVIYTGVNQTDYSGYPDCREKFVDAFEIAASYALDAAVTVQAPLLHLTKAETFKMAEDLGVLELIVKETHTCYRGDRTFHVWGCGCGECPACLLRKKGYEGYLETLP